MVCVAEVWLVNVEARSAEELASVLDTDSPDMRVLSETSMLEEETLLPLGASFWGTGGGPAGGGAGTSRDVELDRID